MGEIRLSRRARTFDDVSTQHETWAVGAQWRRESESTPESQQMTCPVCESSLDWRTAKFGAAFPCVSCGELLRIPDSYTKRILMMSFVVSFGMLVMGGYRELLLLVSLSALITLPVFVGTVMRHLWPPTLALDPGDDGLSISHR